MSISSTAQGERVSADLPHISRRGLVEEGYEAAVADRRSAPDNVFDGGHKLRDLDPNLITLDEDQAEHPRTWPMRKKVLATTIIGLFCFLSPFASTIFAPAVHLVATDLNITDSTVGALQVSIFLFAYAAGPLILAPLSEMYGRAPIQHLGNAVFVAFSVGGGFAKTAAQLAVCRFVAGLGGSASLAIVGGVITDIWDPAARPKAQGFIMLGPIVGPILGPVCGGFMSELASWRWTLWVPGMAAGLLGIVGLLWLPETYGPAVLGAKVRRAKSALPQAPLYSVLDLASCSTTLGHFIDQFARPVVYLFIDPALFLCSLYYATIFGVVYLIVVTYSDVFALGYHHPVGMVGVDFLGLGVGMILATVATVKVQQSLFTKGADGEKKYTPESRLLSGLPGALVCAGGIFMYGFTAIKTHFMVPLVGLGIFAAGAMNVMMAIQLYAVDGFKFPASAFAAISVLRCLFAGAFPLFGAKLFDALGLDWGSALLGFICIALIPVLPLLVKYGQALRKRGDRNMQAFTGSRKTKV